MCRGVCDPAGAADGSNRRAGRRTTLAEVLVGVCGFTIIALVVLSSTPLIRHRLTYETWHVSHLTMYVAIGLAVVHQANGADIAGQRWAIYWLALHLLVFGGVLTFRAGRPIARCARHRFRIDRIVAESGDVTSVYLTGRSARSLRVPSRPIRQCGLPVEGLLVTASLFVLRGPEWSVPESVNQGGWDFTTRIRDLRPDTLTSSRARSAPSPPPRPATSTSWWPAGLASRRSER